MLLPRIGIVALCLGVAVCKEDNDEYASNAFVEAARELFQDKDTVGGLENVANAASAFMGSGAGRQVSEILGGGDNGNGAGQLFSALGSLVNGAAGGRGGDNSQFLGNVLAGFLRNMNNDIDDDGKNNGRDKRESHGDEGAGNGGLDFESMLNVASLFLGQNGQNTEGLMGLLPMVMQNFGGGFTEDANGAKKHDHSGHSWFLPPILENIHVMWEHFSNSELGQTLWKNSGLANIVGTMTDADGNLEYERILSSFENPTLRRRWVKGATNFVADWITHVSDPATRQRYLATAQYVGNGFLKAQGYPKSVMFDPVKPVDSLSRLVDAMAKRHLSLKIDSRQYIKPGIAYFQELTDLASQKGFFVSHLNAHELSNKLSDTLNGNIIEPLLKVYRSYKWGTKKPECAAHILCVINERDANVSPTLRHGMTKAASYPAAWILSNKIGVNFWTLYAAISDSERCFAKHPVDCREFHEDEIRVTTEAIHSEL